MGRLNAVRRARCELMADFAATTTTATTTSSHCDCGERTLWESCSSSSYATVRHLHLDVIGICSIVLVVLAMHPCTHCTLWHHLLSSAKRRGAHSRELDPQLSSANMILSWHHVAAPRWCFEGQHACDTAILRRPLARTAVSPVWSRACRMRNQLVCYVS